MQQQPAVSPQAKSKHSWRVYPLARADQQVHIEQSERLLQDIQPGDLPVLYWSQAETEGIVLGFSQKPEVLSAEELEARPLPIYHRRAGGTAVLVGPHLLSLDVVLPAGHPLVLHDIVESYRWFGEAWRDALLMLGLPARLVSVEEAHTQRDLAKQPETKAYESILRRACYGSLSPYEVAVGPRKVVGLDMIKRRQGSLLQAGVLLHWDPEPLVRLLGHSEEERSRLREGLFARAAGLDSVAGRVVTAEEAIRAFEQQLLEIKPDVSLRQS